MSSSGSLRPAEPGPVEPAGMGVKSQHRQQRGGRLPAPSLELVIYAGAVLVAGMLIVYPLIALFREAVRGVDGSVLGGFLNVLREPRVLLAAKHSVQVSIGTTVVATILGVSLAVIVSRTNTPFTRYMELVGALPLLTMPFVGGIAWTLLASPRVGFLNGLVRAVLNLHMEEGPLNIYSLSGLIWVMGLYYSPYVFLLTNSGLRSIDASMEEAARLAGARPAQVLRRVSIPLVTPAIISGALLTFALASSQFGVPRVIGVPARIEVLPTVIYAKAQTYPVDIAELSGIGLILLAMTATALVLQRYWIRRRVYETVTGKGSRNSVIDLGSWKYLALAVGVGYLFAAVVLPFLALLYASFLRYTAATIRIDLLTLDNYSKVFHSPLTLRSLKNSALLSFVTATLCLALGFILSYLVHRTKLRGRAAIQFMTMIPLGVPSIVLSVGVLSAWIRPPLVLYGSLAILVVAYWGHFLPTAMQAVMAGLLQINRELEDAAHVSFAKWLPTMRYIVVPLIRRSLMAGWLLLVITIFRELSASVLLYVPGKEVMSVALLTFWESGSFNAVAAFSTLVVGLSLLVFVAIQALTGWRQEVTE